MGWCTQMPSKVFSETIVFHLKSSCPCPGSILSDSLWAHQAPLSMEFYRWEYWSGLPFPPPGHFPYPRTEPAPPVLPTLAGRFFTTELRGGAFHLSSVHFSSFTQACPTLCDRMDCSMPAFPVHHQLPELAQAHVHWATGAIQPSHPLWSPFPPAFSLPQHQGLFQSAVRIRWPKYWSFSFSISPSNEYSGLISFRIDWFDLLAVQGTLKSSPTPQFKSIKSSELSFLYCPTLTSIHDYWKNHSFD